MALNRTEKRKFVNDLVKSVKEIVLARVSKMPEDWDGHELRQYLADSFAHQTCKMENRRLKSYRNDVLVNNL